MLLVNALLRRSADIGNPQVVTLATQATQRAPERKDIAWLHMQLCTQVSGCDAAELETRLRTLDADNGFAWLGALARAQQSNDSMVEERILEEIGGSKHFNIYWNTLVSRIAVALSEQAPPPDPKKPSDSLTRAMDQSVNWISTIAIEALQPLVEACSASRIIRANNAQRCAQIAAALQRSDTYIAEGIGLGIAQRLTANTQSAQKVTARINATRYQRDTAGQIIQSQLDAEKFTRELLKLMGTLPREQDVFIAVMRWAGQPLEPTG